MSENNLVQVKETATSILKNNVPERHSLFQLQCFVLAKEPTIQGKLHQCLREIKSRKNSLDAIELEIAEQNDLLELADIGIANHLESSQELTGNNKKVSEIQLRQMERKRKNVQNGLIQLEQKQRDISEEVQFFCAAFDQLSRREKLKPWDDPDVQKEYWTEKLRTEVNVRLLLRQLPDVELMKTIICLHDDSPLKKGVLEMLRKGNEQLAHKPEKV